MCSWDICPKVLDTGNICGHCQIRPKSSGDWLCLKCRRELNFAMSELEHLRGSEERCWNCGAPIPESERRDGGLCRECGRDAVPF